MTNRRAVWLWILLHAIFFVVGWCAATFQSTASTYLGIASAVSVLAVAALSFHEILRRYGTKRGLILLAGLCLYGILIEIIGVQTGFPYGSFTYQSITSFQIAGVPWTTPFAWAPFVLIAFFASRSWLSSSSRIQQLLLAAALLIGLDLVLDPGAVAIGLWSYREGGVYYGVPWTNFAGWILTGGIALFALQRASFSRSVPRIFPFLVGPSAQLAFWVGVTSNLHQIIPSLIGIGLIVFFMKTWLRQSTKTDQIQPAHSPTGTAGTK